MTGDMKMSQLVRDREPLSLIGIPLREKNAASLRLRCSREHGSTARIGGLEVDQLDLIFGEDRIEIAAADIRRAALRPKHLGEVGPPPARRLPELRWAVREARDRHQPFFFAACF